MLTMTEYWVYGVGLSAQVLFSARLIVQWYKSEKAGRVLSPTLFWQLSLIASFLLMVYGILRNDLVIIVGQVLSYFIYIRNLQYKRAWKIIPLHFKAMVLLFPVLAIIWLGSDWSHNWKEVISNPAISGWMLTWGSMGQVVFTFRFVYQWYFSERAQRSVLPTGFWVISLTGSSIIITYGVLRADPVIIIGQVFGILIYIRNLHFAVRKPQTVVSKK